MTVEPTPTSLVRSTAPIEQILESARWAPSGDNTQPWAFEITGDLHVVVHGFDTRDHCVYDLDGHASQISLGALIETMEIAASAHGLRMLCTRRLGLPDSTPTFDIQFFPDLSVGRDQLAEFIELRSVQRRALSSRSLLPDEMLALQQSTGTEFRIHWIQGFRSKLSTALLMFASAKLRLTMPEAYEVHRDVIEWNARFSIDRVPDQALGVDRLTAILMRRVMKSWNRVALFNKYFAGTWLPRIQMDLLPALACGAHFVLIAKHEARSVDDYVSAGRALQRLWLTATKLNLQLQPELTPLIFSRYSRRGIVFSRTPGMDFAAEKVANGLQELLDDEAFGASVFMGRIGAGPAARARSTRKNIAQLMRSPHAATARSASERPEPLPDGRIRSTRPVS